MEQTLSFWEKILDWIRSIFFNKELELTILGLQNPRKSTLVHVLATGNLSMTKFQQYDLIFEN